MFVDGDNIESSNMKNREEMYGFWMQETRRHKNEIDCLLIHTSLGLLVKIGYDEIAA